MVLIKIEHITLEFLLAVERGDEACVQNIISSNPNFDINCCDPLARNALIIAIDKENLSMLKILVSLGSKTNEALLYAIDQNCVEAVELFLDHEKDLHKKSDTRKWANDDEFNSFSPDMTPLIVAAHRNNYEIIKLLLDRNICSLPDPHDPYCECDTCSKARTEDCLRFSKSKINAYKALASPCLMALTSNDPLLKAFELCAKLVSLAKMEPEYKEEYFKIRSQCQTFATSLLDHTRTSKELEILLNHGEELEKLKIAIQCKQKTFCAHPNVQEYLMTKWYENLPGFRRKSTLLRCLQVILIGFMFPFYSIAYLLAPNSDIGSYIKKPFIKFICHSASYMSFLFVLMLASQRIEAFYDWDSIVELFSTTESEPRSYTSARREINLSMKDFLEASLDKNFLHIVPSNSSIDDIPTPRGFESLIKIFEALPASSKKRGAPPSPIELVILVWVLSLIWAEIKQIRQLGMNYYKEDMWNTLDSVASAFYIMTIILRLVSYFQNDSLTDVPREMWSAFDPTLLSEALFAAAAIFSTLKLIYIFSLNPYIGPLQISLGRMIIDILRFAWIYLLVLFSFACGMNQLLWYYADLERHQCLNVTNFSVEQYYKLIELQKHSSRHNHTNTPRLANIDDETFSFSASGNNYDHEVEETSRFPISDDACRTWRYFANVFESVQTLFWATFGLVDLNNFDLSGIKEYTRFWALLMFGCYCFINVVVVLNMLIAMMNHSYVKISQKSDIEWKFARTRLWLSYFDTGSTVPPPFNIIPSPKSIIAVTKRLYRLLTTSCVGIGKASGLWKDDEYKNSSEIPVETTVNSCCHSVSAKKQGFTGKKAQFCLEVRNNGCRNFDKSIETNLEIETSYRNVMRLLVRRYLVHEQRLLERKRGLTEAKLNRWAKLNAFD